MNTREQGFALLTALFMVVVLAGMCFALQMTSVALFRAAEQKLDLQESAYAVDSGVAYYITQLELDNQIFVNEPAPHAPLALGRGTFQLLDAIPGGAGEWELGLSSNVDGIDYRLRGIVGYRQLTIPQGLVINGTGDPTDVTLTITGAAEVASYDPTAGPTTQNSDAGLWVNGSVVLNGTADVQGDATATGTISVASGSSISGSISENGDEIPVDSFESMAAPIIADSRVSNDNAQLNAIFGSSWHPIGGPDNFGD